MELGVLGTLTLSVGGRNVHVGSMLRQRLLGTLACHANTTVPVGRLAEILWADPPVSAPQNLRQYVHHLRKCLPAADRIVRDRQGYRLIVNDGELDADRFETLTLRADRALTRGAPGEAARLLGTALALWRGPAYTDLKDIPVIRRAAVRLEELRLSAIEQRVEARLSLGRHEELVTELAALVAEHPLRERLRGQLMLALHRAGRQAEALEVYQQVRLLLAGEMGLEPGPHLQRLERAIVGGIPVDSVPPAALPADLTEFTGRTAEVARLRDHLMAGPRSLVAGLGSVPIAAVTGAAAVGKSALAIHVAHQVAEFFPGGRLYVDLRSLAPAAALARLLSALGHHDIPVDVDEAACRFRSATHGRRILVVLDNAEDVAQVRPLLPACASSGVLVTSRRSLTGLDGAAHVCLGAPDRRQPAFAGDH